MNLLGGRRALFVGAAALVGVLGARPALAHEVKTKDGHTFEGTVVSQDDAKVVIDTTFDGRKELARADVASVDTSIAPLKDQLAYRVKDAADAAALGRVADWAKGKGWKPDSAEMHDVWSRVLALDAGNVRAHKALGHVQVGAKWMTPEEKAAADAEAADAAMRAKGLVLHQGKWVTPQEKDALEKGLLKDGDQWVTEDVYHARRGEKKVDGKWVRVGEAEGKARAAALGKALGLPMVAMWSPHVDLIHELEPVDAQAILDACEKVAADFYRIHRPAKEDGLDDLRLEIVIPHKAPSYAHYVDVFAKENDVTKMSGMETWPEQAKKLRSFWFTDPKAAIGAYLFPNTLDTVRSNLAHLTTEILLNRYHANFRLWTDWRAEGLAYFLEMRNVGPTSHFTIGRPGVPGGGDAQAWQDSKRWPELLKALALSSQDTPMSRLATMTYDQLGIVDLAKSWSVVKMLLDWDAAKWKAFVDEMKKERDRPTEEALKIAYGVDYRQLEQRWRDTVVGAPPPEPPTPPKGPPGKGPPKSPPGGKKTPP